jgi:integrase
MTVPAQPLKPGEWRAIRCYKPTKARPSWLAVAQFRDPAPPFKVRQRSKTGRTRAGAREALEQTLAEEAQGSAPLDRSTRLRGLADEMFARKRTAVVAGQLADGSLRNYESHWRLYIEPALGDVPVSWLTVRRVDQYLSKLRETKSYALVKGVRSVLTEIFEEGVRQDLLADNPVRKAADIRGDGPRSVKVLPIEDAVWIWYRLQELARTPAEKVNNRRYRTMLCDSMVPDLWLWMLGTGHRISQALAVRWPWIDLDAGTARVGANVTRIRGKGLVVQENTSGKSQVVEIGLPEQVLAMLHARRALPTHDPMGLVFPDSFGGLLDPSNVSSKKLRPALVAIGRAEVSSHWCRRTLATEMDKAGMSLTAIAAQLTHADTRTTERHYVSKRVVNPEMLAAINAMLATEPERRVVPMGRQG